MSTTLTNGLKLPDKGSVDWYADMQSNYVILDGAVGTVAEHTAALAGKAPAVHTHTKADVTDLLNSNFIPSANNSYDLGSSSYQWNNLYAKNYYYNGTAWGLDKNNTWTGANTFTSVLKQKINSVYSQIPATDRFAVHEFLGTDDNRIFTLNCADRSSGQREMSLIVYDTDGTFKASGIFKESDGTFSFKSRSNNEINLGTSTYKWKSLNGINPGALSLPSADDDESFNGDLTNKTGTTSNKKTWSINGWGYIRIANVAGDFISVVATSAHETYLTTGTGSGNDNIGVAFPIVSGREYAIYVKTSGSVVAYYMPTLGNVA